MRRLLQRVFCLLALALILPPGPSPQSASAQEVVDRIVAHVEDDILLLSDVRELGQFQQLIEGQTQPEEKRLDELIDQWIVTHEAAAAQFPQPSATDVKGAREQLEKELGGEQAFQARQSQAGLTAAAIDRQLRRELFVSRYLDYKFRPAAQVDTETIEKYYNEQFTAQLKAQGQSVPPLDAVRAQIRELLVQQQISTHAAQWLGESRSRLKVQVLLQAPAAPGAQPKP
jgi:hypothetical protein